MPLPKERIYTIDDIYALPDGERAELIDGQIYMMAPPNTRHQVIVGELYATIRNYIKSKSGSCKPYVSPFAVFLNEDNKNYVEPDLTVVCSPDKVDEKGCHGAPDWVIEVVSPATQSKDYGIKLFKYRMAGVREYWIINPLKGIVMSTILKMNRVPDCILSTMKFQYVYIPIYQLRSLNYYNKNRPRW